MNHDELITKGSLQPLITQLKDTELQILAIVHHLSCNNIVSRCIVEEGYGSGLVLLIVYLTQRIILIYYDNVLAL